MYCYTYVNNFLCIFNELLLWSDISSEHPIFIRTVAELTKKNISQETLSKLSEVNTRFSTLNKKVNKIAKAPYQTPYLNLETKRLINEFLINDKYFLSVLPEVKQYGKEDKVWQTLLNHITHEQNFMYELFINLMNQIK